MKDPQSRGEVQIMEKLGLTTLGNIPGVLTIGRKHNIWS